VENWNKFIEKRNIYIRKIMYNLCVCIYIAFLAHSLARIDQQEKYWTDKDEIWYRCCATGDYLRIILLNVLRLVVTKWWMMSYESRNTTV
jgi:hypothetical protein